MVNWLTIFRVYQVLFITPYKYPCTHSSKLEDTIERELVITLLLTNSCPEVVQRESNEHDTQEFLP